LGHGFRMASQRFTTSSAGLAKVSAEWSLNRPQDEAFPPAPSLPASALRPSKPDRTPLPSDAPEPDTSLIGSKSILPCQPSGNVELTSSATRLGTRRHERLASIGRSRCDRDDSRRGDGSRRCRSRAGAWPGSRHVEDSPSIVLRGSWRVDIGQYDVVELEPLAFSHLQMSTAKLNSPRTTSAFPEDGAAPGQRTAASGARQRPTMPELAREQVVRLLHRTTARQMRIASIPTGPGRPWFGADPVRGGRGPARQPGDGQGTAIAHRQCVGSRRTIQDGQGGVQPSNPPSPCAEHRLPPPSRSVPWRGLAQGRELRPQDPDFVDHQVRAPAQSTTGAARETARAESEDPRHRGSAPNLRSSRRGAPSSVASGLHRPPIGSLGAQSIWRSVRWTVSSMPTRESRLRAFDDRPKHRPSVRSSRRRVSIRRRDPLGDQSGRIREEPVTLEHRYERGGVVADFVRKPGALRESARASS